MIIGYARTSTADQTNGLEAQRRDLNNADAEKIYEEHASAKTAVRPELEKAISHLRMGDTFMVTKPDRLARSVKDLLDIMETVTATGAHLVILSMGGQKIDTSNPTSKMMLTMLTAVAEFERDLMAERQREGIIAAQKSEKYTGRKSKLTQIDRDLILEKYNNGMPISQIATAHKLCRNTIYKIIKGNSK